MGSDTNGVITLRTDSEAGKKIQEKLSNEATLMAIDGLLSRIDTLEEAVENLSTMLRQGPGLVAMKVDMLDEAYRNADAKGINIDDRLKNALHIAEKLTSPQMVEKLDNLVQLTDQLPGLVAMKVDMLDEAYRNADAKGVNIDERFGNALKLAEKLTHPEMVEKLDNVIQLSTQMPGLIAMTMDMFDEGMKTAVSKGFNPQALLETAGAANTALTEAKAEPPAKVGGLFGMLKVLRDPDRQKGLGFLMNFLKHFGRNL